MKKIFEKYYSINQHTTINGIIIAQTNKSQVGKTFFTGGG
jgi:hypothetical protein